VLVRSSTQLSYLSLSRRLLQSREAAGGWDEYPDRLHQKDLDPRWTKNIDINYYGYNNSNRIDVDHGFNCCYAFTAANINDSQLLPSLLDPENEHDYVWVDTAYLN